MPNRWVEHVKEFARKNNISYGCALSDPNLKKGYIPKGDKRQKAEKLEMAVPDTSVKPKGIVIKPRPKVVIAKFETIRYGGREYAITNDGELLVLIQNKPKSFRVEEMTGDNYYLKKSPNNDDRIDAAYSWLFSKFNGELQHVNHTTNLLNYTKEDANDLKEYGLSMAIPSQKVLKDFYHPAYLRRKDSVFPTFFDEAEKPKEEKPAPAPAPAPAKKKAQLDEDRGYILDEGTDSDFNRYWIIASPTQLGNQVVKETFFRIITDDKDNFKTKSAKTKLYNQIQKANAGEMADLIKKYFNPNSPKRFDYFAKRNFLKDFFTKSPTKGDAKGYSGGAKKKPVKAEPVKLKSGAPKMPTFLDPDTAWNRFAKEYHNPTHGPKVRDRVIERAPNPQTSTRTDTIPVAESKTASTMGAGYRGSSLVQGNPYAMFSA
jgi:hypothetical protein